LNRNSSLQRLLAFQNCGRCQGLAALGSVSVSNLNVTKRLLEQKSRFSRRETVLGAGSGMVLKAEPLARILSPVRGSPGWRSRQQAITTQEL
jgi:hypothetical protein